MLAGATPRHDSLVVGLAMGIAIVLHAAVLLLVELPERGPNRLPEGPSPERPLVFDLPLPPPAPSAGPLRPGENGVSDPFLLERVEPDYPELARRAQLSGDVVLQAVVRADGSVGEIQVLRCTRSGVGFERAAIDAVGRWLYEPATQRGRPVDVFLIVHVRFVLR